MNHAYKYRLSVLFEKRVRVNRCRGIGFEIHLAELISKMFVLAKGDSCILGSDLAF
jgi:hypothetical protein